MNIGFEVVTCGKHREGDKRFVIIQDGKPKDKHVIIVDDLVQTGGTLYECGKKQMFFMYNSKSRIDIFQ